MTEFSFHWLAWIFFTYAFIGWGLEVAYHAVTMGRVVNRGFLNGPICPVYGVGMLLILLFGEWVSHGQLLQMSLGWLFLLGIVFATGAELAAGWALDKLFHARWWDYSQEKFNLGGYICLRFSLLWGLAIVFVLRLIHPRILDILDRMDALCGAWAVPVLVILLAADIGISAATAVGLNRRLAQIDAAAKALRALSDPASSIIADSTLKVVRPLQEGRVRAELAKAELHDAADETKEKLEQRRRELRETRQAHLDRLHKYRFFGQGRLLNAFPSMNHHRYTDALHDARERLKKIS